jgi:hypothetical protein
MKMHNLFIPVAIKALIQSLDAKAANEAAKARAKAKAWAKANPLPAEGAE